MMCKVIREIATETFERKVSELVLDGGYRMSSSGRIPTTDKEFGEWWAIMVREE